jgi:hypothetical protein
VDRSGAGVNDGGRRATSISIIVEGKQAAGRRVRR